MEASYEIAHQVQKTTNKEAIMKFTQFYSSSKGNLYIVTANNGNRLLIECGVAWQKIQQALNYNLTGITGCLLTHEHKDHSKAVKEVMQAGIDVYASEGTFDALEIQDRRAIEIQKNTLVKFKNGFQVLAFEANHDCAEPLGFIVRCDNEFLFFATDTSHISQRFKVKFSIIAIECSYNQESLERMVAEGQVPEFLAARLLKSHMEQATTMRYLKEFCDLSRCREIHLLHMSGTNITHNMVRDRFEKRLFIKTVTIDSYSPVAGVEGRDDSRLSP